MDVGGHRSEYASLPLPRKSLAESPIDEFARWLEEARGSAVIEPTAMVLCTASAAGVPSSRTVLLKDFSEHGFTFFTNYDSRKGEELLENPFASATFLWMPLFRQVTIEGRVKKVPKVVSQEYFASRPRGSQLAAWASHQGEVLDSRDELEKAYQNADEQYQLSEVPCPNNWGGYTIEPTRIEFWQGRPSRLHDRFSYIKADNGWSITRVSP